jgi:hypothetical protein
MGEYVATGTELYLDALESMLGSLHRPRVSAFWDGAVDDREWGHREGIRHHFAIGFAVLEAYRSDPEYEELTTRYLRNFEAGNHFTSLHLGTAYELVGDSLSQAERRTFAENWVADARAFDHLPDDVSREEIRDWDHVTNHALCACFWADYARYLFPEESDAYDLASITDPVWEVWWEETREFHEGASNYEGFSECYLASWAERRGVAEEFYASPAVRNMFERVASETGEGTYRRAARDVFEYARRTVLSGLDRTLERVDPGELRVTFLHPDASSSVTELAAPSIYEEAYTAFPTTEYREVWRESYTTRRCLSAPDVLEGGEEHLFAARLEPRTPD